MKTCYELEVSARCPVNDARDHYAVTVTADRTIKVEDINAAVEGLVAEPLLQEDLTQRLAALLRCRVVTVGYHSGVRTRVSCRG